jgi:hypothetical protein
MEQLKAEMRKSGLQVATRNGKKFLVRSPSSTSGARARPQARKETQKPSVGRQSGGIPSGEHAEGGE